MRRSKKNKIIKYFKVRFYRLKKLGPVIIFRWFIINIRSHPFISGFLLFFWSIALIKHIFVYDIKFRGFYTATIIYFITWLFLVWLFNLLKDRNTKWYYRKIVVLTLLTLYAPVGILFLWVGSKFKRITKIILTVVFSLFFAAHTIYFNIEAKSLLNKSTLQAISEMVGKSKEKIFLSTAPIGLLGEVSIGTITKVKPRELSTTQISKKCIDSVVSITTKDRLGKDIGLGSGFIISQDGIIVTNFHVMEGAYKATVKTTEQSFDNVKLIVGKPSLDIAILKIEAIGLPPIVMGDSNYVQEGEQVVAIGNPLGLERTISNGIISGVHSSNNIELIQMTTPVSRGSSGGPIINVYGQVIGITTLATEWGAQNLNFAIPINYIKAIILSSEK